MVEENLANQAGVHSVEVVCLIWSPLNTGFTVTHLHLLPQLFLQRQWPCSTLQLAAAAGRVINRGPYPSLLWCVVILEVQWLEWLLVATRILLDMWRASSLIRVLDQCDTVGAVKTHSGYRRLVVIDLIAIKTPVFKLGGHTLPICFKRSQLHLPLLPDLIYDKHSLLLLSINMPRACCLSTISFLSIFACSI